jgi:hypothetical protein
MKTAQLSSRFARFGSYLLKFTLGVGILAWLLYQFDLGEVVHVTLNFPIKVYPVLIAAVVAVLACGALRLWVLDSKCWNRPLSSLSIAYTKVQFIGLFIPGRVSDLLLLRKSPSGTTPNRAAAASAIIVDRFLSCVAVVVFGQLGLAFIYSNTLWLVGAGLALVVALGFFYATPQLLQLVKRLNIPLPLKFHGIAQRIDSALTEVLQHSRGWPLFLNLGLFGLRVMISALTYQVLFQSIDITASSSMILAAMYAAHLVLLVPLTLWGLGTSEMALVFFFNLVPVRGDIVLSVALLSRLITILLLSVVYFFIPDPGKACAE